MRSAIARCSFASYRTSASLKGVARLLGIAEHLMGQPQVELHVRKEDGAVCRFCKRDRFRQRSLRGVFLAPPRLQQTRDLEHDHPGQYVIRRGQFGRPMRPLGGLLGLARGEIDPRKNCCRGRANAGLARLDEHGSATFAQFSRFREISRPVLDLRAGEAQDVSDRAGK